VYHRKEQGSDANIDARLTSDGLCGPCQIWVGKDYVNFIRKDFCDLDNPFDGVYPDVLICLFFISVVIVLYLQSILIFY